MLPRVRARFARWRARFGPRVFDGYLIACAVAASAGQVAGDGDRSFPIGRWLSIPVMAVAAAALWWRRRWPLAITAIGCAAFALANAPLTGLFGLTTVAVRRRDRALAGSAAAVYAVYVLQPVIFQEKSLVAQLVGMFFVVGLFLILGGYVGARRDLVASLRERADRAESERELRAEQARLGERTRIAQEMHDVLAHKVSLIALHAGGLELNPDAGPDTVERSAILIRSTARQALEDLRDVLGVLRTDESADGATLAPQPKLSDVRRLVDASRAAGVTVELVVEGDAAALSDPDRAAAAGNTMSEQLGRTAYRVVQEGLTNVHKHARGASTTVRVSGERGQMLRVSIANIKPVAVGSLLPGAGAGLVGLRERVELAGGTLTAGAGPDGGWLLAAELPWPATVAADVDEVRA
ncbi:MAG: sensor histidine kinase [Actinomycetales bacterium]